MNGLIGWPKDFHAAHVIHVILVLRDVLISNIFSSQLYYPRLVAHSSVHLGKVKLVYERLKWSVCMWLVPRLSVHLERFLPMGDVH